MSPASLPRCGLALVTVASLLFVLSVTGGALATAELTDASADADAAPTNPDGIDLPERLDPESVDAEGTGDARPDAGTAVRTDGLELESAYQEYYLEENLDRAADDQERSAILEGAVDAVNETTNALRERERAAQSAYESGDIDEEQFLRELVRIDARADAGQQQLTAIHDEATQLAIPGIRPPTSCSGSS